MLTTLVVKKCNDDGDDCGVVMVVNVHSAGAARARTVHAL